MKIKIQLLSAGLAHRRFALNLFVFCLMLVGYPNFSMAREGGGAEPQKSLSQAEHPHENAAIKPAQIAALFELTQVEYKAIDLVTMANQLKRSDTADVNWPLLCYLTAELQLKYKDIPGAKRSFLSLIQWGGNLSEKDPYLGTWGGSGVIGVGLWRYLTILNREGDLSNRQTEITDLLRISDKIMQTPFFVGMESNSLLPSIPLLRENIASLLVKITWKAGLEEEARRRFTNLIAVDSSGSYDDPEIQEIKNEMLKRHEISEIRLKSFRLHRKLMFTTTWSRKSVIADQIKTIWEDEQVPDDLRISAGYEWAYFNRKEKRNRAETIRILQSIIDNYSENYPVTTQKSLYLIAMMNNSGSTDLRDRNKFFEYMLKIINDYPNGQMADDALYQVASEYLFFPVPDWESALKYFKRLREYKGPNDRLDSAYFLGAMVYINRNQPGDLRKADELLRQYLAIRPNGVFHLRCRFWRARISEMQNRLEEARGLFSEVIGLAPYSYYGIRARMHLEYGAEAANLGFPDRDSKVLNQLHSAFAKSTVVSSLLVTTPFHKRLSGNEKLYAKTKRIVDGIGKAFRERLDNIKFEQLDAKQLIPAVTLLLALRQDAIAARKTRISAENSLRLAGFFGTKMKDWPMALSMLHIRSDEPRERLKALMGDPHYLATSYPSPSLLPGLLSAFQSAIDKYRWAGSGSEMDEFVKSIMYSVVRRESSFFPEAISNAGAIGWFQLLPTTYEAQSLRSCQSGCERFSPFNPVCNATFWTCWVKKEKLMAPPESNESPFSKVIGSGDIRLSSVFGLVKHNAGSGTLERWIYEWGDKPMAADLEMKIDTFRFITVQHFVRRVIGDVVIMESSGAFSDSSTLARGAGQ